MNEEKKQDELNAQLHTQHRREINDIRRDVEKLVKEDMGIRADIKDVGTGLKYLTDRLNEGVAKTGIKTWEKVNEISQSITNMAHENEKRDIVIDNTRQSVSTAHKRTDKIIGVIFALFVAIVSSLIGMIIWVIKYGGVQ